LILKRSIPRVQTTADRNLKDNLTQMSTNMLSKYLKIAKNGLLLASAVLLTACTDTPACDNSVALKFELDKRFDEMLSDELTPPLREYFKVSRGSLRQFSDIIEFSMSGVTTLSKTADTTYCKAQVSVLSAITLELSLRDDSDRGQLYADALGRLDTEEASEFGSTFDKLESKAARLELIKQALANDVKKLGYTDVSFKGESLVGKYYTDISKSTVEYALRYSDDRKTVYVELIR